jgi:hypothetical protein
MANVSGKIAAIVPIKGTNTPMASASLNYMGKKKVVKTTK